MEATQGIAFLGRPTSSNGHLQANDGNVDDKYIKLYYPIQSRIYTDLQYFTIYNIVIESGCIGMFKHCRTFLQPGLNFANVCQAECSLDLDQIYLQGQLEVFPAWWRNPCSEFEKLSRSQGWSFYTYPWLRGSPLAFQLVKQFHHVANIFKKICVIEIHIHILCWIWFRELNSS